MIVATAGHVDHGKTSLVRQLTGVDTDRLEEEKRRGLSINLGFAYRDAGGGHRLGFVDVPGHTRFINTMIAGVSGIDLGMLVVAADDGIMPQTREHLSVLRLLGITQFIGVITKIDRVEATRTTQVHNAVLALLNNHTTATTAPNDWPIFSVSNQSGEGIDTLRDYLDRRARAHHQRSAEGNFRLSVDRAFVMKGAGLVLTGTAIAGEVTVGDTLRLLPRGTPLRVRSLRVQNTESQKGRAGDRCALDVTGAINREQVERGDALVAGDNFPLSSRCDARASLLADAPFAIRHLSPVKIHIGARRQAARLFLLDAPTPGKLHPGQTALVQLLLDEPLPCCRGDRFLLRDDSESATLGGGMILDPLAPRTGKAGTDRLLYLQAMAQSTPQQALAMLLGNNAKPVNVSALGRAWNLRAQQEPTLLADINGRHYTYESDTWAVSTERWCALEQQVLDTLRHWHSAHPDQNGIKASQVQDTLREAGGNGLLQAVLTELLRARRLHLANGLLHLDGFKPRVSGAQQSQWAKLAATLEASGLQPPLVSELATRNHMEKRQALAVLQSAARSGEAVKLNDNRYALPRQLLACADIVRDLAASDTGITVVAFKDRIGSGRKVAIEILEHFDAIRFTQRRQEQRLVLNEALPVQMYGGK